MTTETLTLADFLLARIAEDEAVARDFIAEGPWQAWAADDRRGPERDDEYAQLTIGAARVLAECEAKRRIIEWAQDGEGEWRWGSVLHPLAVVYAQHPDYRGEWAS